MTESTSSLQHSKLGGVSKVFRVVMLVLALMLGVIAAIFGLASLIPGLGPLSTVAARLAPTMAPIVALAGLIVLVVGIVAVRRGHRRTGAVATVLGGIGAVANIAVVIVLVGAITSAGGSVNIFAATFGLSAMDAATPDRHEVYDKTSSGDDLSLSIYEPRGANGSAPTIMVVHGGGWIAGEPNATSSELRTLADHGYLVVSVEYELATRDNATWQSAPAQVACAATWIQVHAGSLGADMDRLAFWGESSGGNLVANTAGAAAEGSAESSCGGKVPVPAAVVADYPAFDVTGLYESAPAGPGAGTGSRIFATSYTGGTPEEFPKRCAAVNSATHLIAAAPPTLMMTAMRDDVIMPADQLAWADAARDRGVDVQTVQVPLANHAYTQKAKNSLGSQGHLSIAEAYLSERLR
ncbi:MAG: alpha/beta hydrolase [Brevibacterium sp.]|uniref:alpha/beta hydrolase n=1 Tax=Brevibacterium sp. TaxID=1701 RepID=UPI0026477E31|nr:alpha/beta hydrolase [Brevibacterium sp.]MDN5806241.1 alpha/beta hydrolase [Brevibacterium sp.]MDN5832769.1 alpha/beta hydrolase [Brevibacterium sp.]MDN5875396.1 alpha/beta hydrolase [Brevibacterium sp.]MDN5908571.1 alpha/beta hydrolase [Brevibacterium sp.]MDN6133074.1 alpha/beta hydrolase [Brevibacterium sp.]